MLSHDLAIQVKVRLSVPAQRPLGDEAVEIFTCLGVDAWVVRRGALGQINLRSTDMQKAARPPLGHLFGLGGRHHIVG